LPLLRRYSGTIAPASKATRHAATTTSIARFCPVIVHRAHYLTNSNLRFVNELDLHR
jgi:hypothetical protein